MAVLRMPQVDPEALREVVRDLSLDLDRSRLSAIRDDLGRIELPTVGDLRDELARLELPRAGDVRRELQRFERDMPDVGRFLGRPARRAAFALPAITPALVFGAVALLAGSALGGVLAWLYQPGAGPQRRKAARRRLHRLQRSIQHSR